MMKINRRKVLKYGLGGSFALVVGGLSLSLQSTKMVTPAAELLVLSEKEYSVLYAIAERLIPANGNFPAASELDVAQKVDIYLSTCHTGIQKEFKQLLAIFENATFGLLFNRKMHPFTQYEPDKQDEIIESWRTSQFHFRRTAFFALNRICGGVYFADKKSFAAIGYKGPPPNIQKIFDALGDR